MDPSSISPLIFAYVVLILCSAYCCATEMAFSSVTKIKLLNYRDKMPKKVDLALSVQEKYNFYLITLLIGSNIVNAGCAAVSTIFATRVYHAMTDAGKAVAESAVTAVCTAVTTIVIFLFCETIPKNFAKDNCERVALSVVPVLKFLSFVLYPLTAVFMGISRLIEKIIGAKPEPTVTEEELSAIIENSEEGGTLDEDQSELLQSALEFSDTRVADVLTLRDDVVWLDIHASQQEILKQIRATCYSRLPVCNGSLDKPVGVLLTVDFLKAYIGGTYTRISRLLRKPYFTTLDAPIDDIRTDMCGKRQHLALVRDKTGESIVGIVTIEDFLEELVGEIFDENDTVDENFMKLGGNYFEVSGKLTLAETFRRMGYRPENPVSPHKLISTWVLEQLGRIPEEDDEFGFGDLTVTVIAVEGNRVSRLEIKMADPEIDIPEEEPDASSESEVAD